MYTDLFGKNRWKLNLHTHTTVSDGQRSPGESAAIYKAAGYDCIAITDHWTWHASGELSGLHILSGAEYNIGFDCAAGVYHIVALGCEYEPFLTKDAGAQEIIDEILRCKGMPVLAHPHWSLNTVSQLSALTGVEATEIWNSISAVGQSSRPTSEHFADSAACAGYPLPLLAADDTHHYDDGDQCIGWIMLECDENASDRELLAAIREKKFYATQGPEVHIFRDGNNAVVRCSPASRIAFLSNAAWAPAHSHTGDGITGAVCPLQPYERFIRAEVTDADGKKAWTNYLTL